MEFRIFLYTFIALGFIGLFWTAYKNKDNPKDKNDFFNRIFPISIFSLNLLLMLDTSYRYNYSEAKSDRIKYKIPKIEEKMRLKERKIEYEKWINKDLYQQNISHHLKEINIGTHSINK